MILISRQSGSVLVVSLLMLVVLTGLAVSAVNVTSLNLRMVGGTQDKLRAESAVQFEIDRFISSVKGFEVPAVKSFNRDGYVVKLTTTCVTEETSIGWQENYSFNTISGVRYDTHWRINAVVEDGKTQEEFSRMEQGVKVKDMLAKCPVMVPAQG